MYVRVGRRRSATDNMGYALSRLEIDSEYYDSDMSNYGVDENSSPNLSVNHLDHEVAQLTKLRAAPHENLSHSLPGKREYTISTVKMLAGRECNYSGRGRFSLADRYHVLSKYLPVNSPCVVDQMTTQAYASQFSADGSLCTVAFQGSHITIYNVERGWKVHKNILAKSLRWTVTDASLSPDQRHLVYATMSPIVHIVNVGPTATEPHANIMAIQDGLDFSAEDDGGYYSFGILSVKFSTDGQELVAGSSDDAIYVYDLEANKLSLQIEVHTDYMHSSSMDRAPGHLPESHRFIKTNLFIDAV